MNDSTVRGIQYALLASWLEARRMHFGFWIDQS